MASKIKTAINKEQDTLKVNRNILALIWTAREAERIPEVVNDAATGKIVKTGNVLTISGNSFVYLSQAVFDWFAITPFTGTLPDSDETKRILVRAHQRTIVTSAIGATTETTRPVNVIEFEREAPIGKGARTKNRVKVQLMGLSTAKGKSRYLTIPFPKFFNRHMISQALATMFASTIEARRPIFYFPIGSNASYKIPYGANPSGLMNDWLTGAWATATTLGTEANIGNPGGNITTGSLDTAGSSGDADV